LLDSIVANIDVGGEEEIEYEVPWVVEGFGCQFGCVV
jgi:hypothetical protein